MTDACPFGPLARIQYVADGNQTRFDLPFTIEAAADLRVYANDLPATGYSATGLGPTNAGAVEFQSPPATGTTITILRRLPLARAGAFADGGPFRAAAVNAELDRLLGLVEDARSDSCRTIQAPPHDAATDLTLPASPTRAGRLLGFDSAGQPKVYALGALPGGGDIGGHEVQPDGASVARSLAEHLAAVVDVRDFGALGDGVTDDSAAFQAALAAAAGRRAIVRVPASSGSYVLASPLTIDGGALVGDGVGSVLRLAHGGPAGITLTGKGPRVAGLRLVGAGAAAYPEAASDVDLNGIVLDGILIGAGAENAVLAEIGIAALRHGVVVAGGLRALLGADFDFLVTGLRVEAGATGRPLLQDVRATGCSRALHVTAGATIGGLTCRGGGLRRCGTAVELVDTGAGRIALALTDVTFATNSQFDLLVGPRNNVTVESCHIGDGGRAGGSLIDILPSADAANAASMTVGGTRGTIATVRPIQLSGGTNLNLMAAGDRMVLASAADDIDNHWTLLKATRAGIVQRVVAQTVSTATVEIATAAGRPLPVTSDVVRVIGRSGTANVGTVDPEIAATDPAWLRASDASRIIARHNDLPATGIKITGTQAELHLLPARAAERTRLAGVELHRGAVNGARTALHTFTIAPGTAVSFVPPSPIGTVTAFGHGLFNDLAACMFSYRADSFGYARLVGGAHVATAQTLDLTALTGTTGNANVITYSAHSDGRIYVENRRAQTWTVSLHVVGAPL